MNPVTFKTMVSKEKGKGLSLLQSHRSSWYLPRDCVANKRHWEWKPLCQNATGNNRRSAPPQQQQQKEKNEDHHVLINKNNILTYTLFFSLYIYMNIIYNGFKTAEQVGETEENEGS